MMPYLYLSVFSMLSLKLNKLQTLMDADNLSANLPKIHYKNVILGVQCKINLIMNKQNQNPKYMFNKQVVTIYLTYNKILKD